MSTPVDLPLPQALSNLLESGFWPATEADSLSQNLKSLVRRDIIKAFAPDEDFISFYRPPFRSVSWCRKHGEQFWDWPMSAAPELDAERTLLIGDFGLGSYAPIALDFRPDRDNPCVIQLQWSQNGNHWIEIAATFDEFAEMILE